MLPVLIRPAEEGDRPFVLASWADSYLGHAPHIRSWTGPDPELQREMVRAYRRRLSHATEVMEILVASHQEDKGVLFGFVARDFQVDLEIPVMHYIFVKEPYRGLGIAKRLMEGAGLLYDRLAVTHWTRDCESYQSNGGRRMDFRPSLFSGLKKEKRERTT